MHYSISGTSLQTRKKNILLGALFALVLAAVITAGHFQYPETYNNVVFWSVIIAMVVGNLVNFYRRKGQVEHIQLKLRNGRGIRLEGYADLEQLGGAIADRIPKELVVGRKP